MPRSSRCVSPILKRYQIHQSHVSYVVTSARIPRRAPTPLKPSRNFPRLEQDLTSSSSLQATVVPSFKPPLNDANSSFLGRTGVSFQNMTRMANKQNISIQSQTLRSIVRGQNPEDLTHQKKKPSRPGLALAIPIYCCRIFSNVAAVSLSLPSKPRLRISSALGPFSRADAASVLRTAWAILKAR